MGIPLLQKFLVGSYVVRQRVMVTAVATRNASTLTTIARRRCVPTNRARIPGAVATAELGAVPTNREPGDATRTSRVTPPFGATVSDESLEAGDERSRSSREMTPESGSAPISLRTSAE